MTQAPRALILDFLEWIAVRPRPYDEVMNAWRTSCPRLPVWEDAVAHGWVARRRENAQTFVELTEAGRSLLSAERAMHRGAAMASCNKQRRHTPLLSSPASGGGVRGRFVDPSANAILRRKNE